MKRVLLTVALVLMLCGISLGQEPNEPVIPPASGLTFWGGTEGDASSALEARIGYELTSGFEPGIGIRYLAGDPEWGPVPDVLMPYLCYHVKEMALIVDDEPDNAWEEILHSLRTRPYGLGGIDIPVRGEQRRPKLALAVGTLFGNDPTFRTAFYIEYGMGDLTGKLDQTWKLGGRFRF